VSIHSPFGANDWNVNALDCPLFYTSAVNSSGSTSIDAGISRCGANQYLDGETNCHQTTQPYFTFVEYQVGGLPTCVFVSNIALNQVRKVSVKKNDGSSIWLAYVDGVAKGDPAGINLGNADVMESAGELPYDPGTETPFLWFAVNPPGPLWERWNGSTWNTVNAPTWTPLYAPWWHSDVPPHQFMIAR
jgi:hypothetical protein